ncbi:hypothetical protein, partial [Capnocytophaga canimorsus]|uniref:hypothetical protein n=1 Tax=Capnocytophaga canimorsus TaxID=28188 RepID=UPI001EDF19E6
MNREQRKREIQQRIREIQAELSPIAYRQIAFSLAGAVLGGVLAWQTKQKWYVKGAAILGGSMCAKLISASMVSTEKHKLVSELTQLKQELKNMTLIR